jgi:hypothetical protein
MTGALAAADDTKYEILASWHAAIYEQESATNLEIPAPMTFRIMTVRGRSWSRPIEEDENISDYYFVIMSLTLVDLSTPWPPSRWGLRKTLKQKEQLHYNRRRQRQQIR